MALPGVAELARDRLFPNTMWLSAVCDCGRVKSGKFGRSAKFGQRPCLFHILMIGIKNKLPMQTVKIPMRRLIRSRLIWITTVCKCMSEFT